MIGGVRSEQEAGYLSASAVCYMVSVGAEPAAASSLAEAIRPSVRPARSRSGTGR